MRPLGASAARRVDVRVIAATNREIAARRDGRGGRELFREDLYYRLSVVVITVPPLRERREDIPLLAEHFLALHARRHGQPRPHLSQEALSRLMSHAWPGNVRELEKALNRAVMFCEGGRVRGRDLEVGGSQARLGDRDTRHAEQGLTPRQAEILRVASESGVIRRRDIIERFGLSGEAARRDLHTLTRHGLLRREGNHRGSRYLAPESNPERWRGQCE